MLERFGLVGAVAAALGLLAACGQSEPAALAQRMTLAIEREDDVVGRAPQREAVRCLSKADGSSRSFVAVVREELGDPDSFRPIDTTLASASASGRYPIRMTYRTRDGGNYVGTAIGVVDPDTCEATLAANPAELEALF